MSKKNNKPKRSDNFCVYLGPSITFVIQTGTVYPGTKKEVIGRLSEEIAKYPLIETLIVPDYELAKARTQVITPGNPLYRNYHRLAKN